MRRAYHAMKRPFGKARVNSAVADRSMSFALPLLATAGLFHFLLEVGEDDSELGIRLSFFRRNARRMLACLSNLPGSLRGWGTPLWGGGSSVYYHGHGRSFCGFTPSGRSPVPSCFACRQRAIQQQPDVMGPRDVVTRLWRSVMPVLLAVTLWFRRPQAIVASRFYICQLSTCGAHGSLGWLAFDVVRQLCQWRRFQVTVRML